MKLRSASKDQGCQKGSHCVHFLNGFAVKPLRNAVKTKSIDNSLERIHERFSPNYFYDIGLQETAGISGAMKESLHGSRPHVKSSLLETELG